ncbi:MAG: inositol monophosphatase family protein [Reichenbachiella sp.]|uniref:3'(2'),5'-bisphosphate nucleotidase CysQ family protein n=1 Tax=Reichenbachiella sp. TaxID=2184521 RepID=UPI0029676998|nr:inositol monophosphatase family protein [Reichenbachiella sp.]MDW3210612.1 inositol monophosphatase family protein [Reichenbachiella sp.]
MKLSTNDIQSLAQVAQKATHIAAAYIQSQVKETHHIELKDGIKNLATQVVTAIDLESQRLILEELKPSLTTYDLGLLTEELPDDGSRLGKDYFWCIDPLDGTLPFTEQEPGYAVSIALINQAGDPIIGAIADPYQKEYWLGIKGSGVLKNDEPYEFEQKTKTLVCQLDRSFLTSASYEPTVDALQSLCRSQGYEEMAISTGKGAVMNVMSLLTEGSGCYVKWPKTDRGGGCIWDYAATRLIFEVLGLPVSTASGMDLPLNQKEVYMNNHGVIYSTSQSLQQEIIRIGKQLHQGAK